MFLAAPGDVLTKAIRQELVNNWTGPNKADLQAKLNENKMGAFDGLLLSYMTGRAGQQFYWDTGDVTEIKDWINSYIVTTSLVSNADKIVDHIFPNGANSSYDYNMGAGDINWSTVGPNAEFVCQSRSIERISAG